MNVLENIRRRAASILVVGNHAAIVQSILDFDFISGKKVPSVKGIVTTTRKAQKFFFGSEEILIPCYPSIDAAKENLPSPVSWLLNLQSGRRAYATTVAFFDSFPKSLGAHIFAENVPEKHAIFLMQQFSSKYFIAGPSGVGFLVPGALKLGAIGGIDVSQIEAGFLHSAGNIAIGSTSGGMTNELIRAVVAANKRVSFAIAVGGDRFPIASLSDVCLLAQNDRRTDAFVYFGELGGTDEYEIIELINKKRFTKPVVAYIAGSIDEAFADHVQFGHAKALVRQEDESASAKRKALREVGVIAPDTFSEFLKALQSLPSQPYTDITKNLEPLMKRQSSILSTRNLLDLESVPSSIKKGKLIKKERGSFIVAATETLLGSKPKSPVTVAFVDDIFALSIDHGGNVSGAVNTMITARAGKDLVSSLAAGLLTIGPRFGGAVNEAASHWHQAIVSSTKPSQFVDQIHTSGRLIAGIGHKKYRVGLPDPRVEALSQFASLLKKHPHYDFARSVEKITTGKNGSLILNVDGTIAALMLDILKECEGFSNADLQESIDAELFNSFFVIPRTVGFIGHFLEQKMNDEGLFRLPDELLFTRNNKKTPKKNRGSK